MPFLSQEKRRKALRARSIALTCLALLGIALAIPAAASATPIVGASIFVPASGEVKLTYLGNTAAYSNDLTLYLPPGAFPGVIFNNHATPVGTVVSLGSFASGTELVFRLHVNNTGRDFYTGSGVLNPDGLPHARVDFAYSPTEALVEFEDLLNTPEFPGGFNDLRFSLTRVGASPVPEPSSVLLLVTGLVGLVGYGWQRKQTA